MSEIEPDIFLDFDELEPKWWYCEYTFKAPDMSIFDDKMIDRIMDNADERDLGPQFSTDRAQEEVALSVYARGTLRRAAYLGLVIILNILEEEGVSGLIPIKATLLEEDEEPISVRSGEVSEDEIESMILEDVAEALREGTRSELDEIDLTQTVLAMWEELRQFDSEGQHD